jgi:hypothetical protein
MPYGAALLGDFWPAALPDDRLIGGVVPASSREHADIADRLDIGGAR